MTSEVVEIWNDEDGGRGWKWRWKRTRKVVIEKKDDIYIGSRDMV